ncbi:hypothetical protein [Novosphingopyxis sp.]|uniref:hypothetical protein n=1 Tax=Novosphingopyxis sp. TaxID=2709690 RepID=UPI003B5CB5CD
MKRSRSMVGFIDLSLILLGSVALIGELQQRDSKPVKTIKSEQAADRSETIHVAIGRLFEPDEARLSVQGASWVRQLARQAGGRRVSIRVAIDDLQGSARLDGWEQAAARTAAIMHAMKTSGYPARKLEPAMPRDGKGPSGVTVSIHD